jgi:hypothetical protein
MTAVTLGVAIVAGCAQPEPGPALPTFPAASATSDTTATAGPDQGAVPDDCARLITAGDLGALLGLPLDSVAVRSTVGVPAPAVDRTERLDCGYTGTANGPARGHPLLSVNAAAYATPAAAAEQWRRNADVEDGTRRDVPIGAARSVLVERRGEALLTVVYGSGTLTLTLPDRPLPRDRADVLVDLAQRVLPAIAATAPVPTTPPRTPSPARAAGAS